MNSPSRPNCAPNSFLPGRNVAPSYPTKPYPSGPPRETIQCQFTSAIALALLGAVGLIGVASPAEAQLTAPLPEPGVTPPPAPTPSLSPTGTPLFENITVTSSPTNLTLRGISGGSQLASVVSGRQSTDTGVCSGYVDGPADHRILLTDAFDYLSLMVQSTDDTTLVVRGRGGSWCSDDLNGLNPGVVGAWLPGAYDVWVGSYRPDGYFPYVIRLSTEAPAAEEPVAEN
ncbi:MAG: hypothetical protein AAF289_22515 [Cyanobacteria bacterium P01_A01_bin.135]